MKLYFIGNCWIYAQLARLFFGGTITISKNETSNCVCGDKHFYVKYSWGYFDFYKKLNLFPGPLQDFCYMGQFRFKVIE